MLKKLTFLFIVLFLVTHGKKLTINCLSTCKVQTNCTAACYVYDYGNQSTEVCMDAITTGGNSIKTCSIGFPILYEISACQSPNISNTCSNKAGCCVRISLENQCLSGLMPTSVTCPTGVSIQLQSGSCKSTPSCLINKCIKTTYNVSSIIDTYQYCVSSKYSQAEYYLQEKFTYIACSLSTCSSGCCFSGVFESKSCITQSNTLSTMGIYGIDLCDKLPTTLSQIGLRYFLGFLIIINFIMIE